ncbi:MAG: NAD-dependent malic enzyme [Planctomycetaceae bacterium]|nr:MAG: NAD-dependent malic enzyme [Planctomycetaceae bacterium]
MSSLQALHDRFGRNVAFGLRVRTDGNADTLSKIISAISGGAASVGRVELLETPADGLIYQLQIFAASDAQIEQVRSAVAGIADVSIVALLDLAMEAHRGGSCEMRSRMPITSNTDLRVVYTPGVARVCKAIEAQPSKAREFTGVANKVAIATNGTAILGLGDIGCLAGLPVMEGKSAIFWEFVKISAEPVLIDTHDADEFINIMEKLACGFGAIQVEDVAAPECFRITRELDRRLNIPVMHDDQHGTATVVMAGLFSALAKTGKKIGDIRCVMSGAGAAGTAIADLLMHEGVADVVLCDRTGAIYNGRKEGMNAEKVALAQRTNKEGFKGSLADAMKGRDLFIGVSQANIVSKEMVRSMAKDPIIFALANPVSEISKPDAMSAGAAVYADGRMMNNALAYPGIFRGLLDMQATMVTVEMVTAAARALARQAGDNNLMPEMMDPATHQAVVQAVMSCPMRGEGLVK